MTRNGPLFTLLAGGLFGAALLVASMLATPTGDDEPAAAEVSESPAPGETAEPDPADATPEPTDTPQPEDAPEPTDTPDAVPPEPDAITYVGYVDGGGASVAVIVTGDEAIAYVCDGVAVEAWLTGTAIDGELELNGDQGSLTGSFDDQQASGETTAADRTWTFTIEQVDAPEGLYRFADTVVGGAEVVGGWIVLPDGTQVGLTNVDGETRPAELLDVDSGQVMVEGQLVSAERQG